LPLTFLLAAMLFILVEDVRSWLVLALLPLVLRGMGAWVASLWDSFPHSTLSPHLRAGLMNFVAARLRWRSLLAAMLLVELRLIAVRGVADHFAGVEAEAAVFCEACAGAV
jgi:hypothetical protein